MAKKSKGEEPVTLSVIVTAHNSPKEIQRMFGQVWNIPDRVEVIIVDDCSSDDGATAAACDTVAASLGYRAKALHLTEWGHVGNARNKGVEASRGEWLWICDGDDEIQSGAFGRIVDAILAEPKDIYYLPHTEMTSSTSPVVHLAEGLESLPVHQWRVAPWARVISRRVWVPFRTMHHYEDCDWGCLIADRCTTRGVVNGDPLYIYHNMGGNSMAGVYALQRLVEGPDPKTIPDIILDPQYSDVAWAARDRLALLSALVDLYPNVRRSQVREHVAWLIRSWASKMVL